MESTCIAIRDENNTSASQDEDIISELPNDILLRILQRLDMRKAIQTGVLSTRWMHLPHQLSYLKISVDDFRGARVTVDQIILVSSHVHPHRSLILARSDRQPGFHLRRTRCPSPGSLPCVDQGEGRYDEGGPSLSRCQMVLVSAGRTKNGATVLSAMFDDRARRMGGGARLRRMDGCRMARRKCCWLPSSSCRCRHPLAGKDANPLPPSTPPTYCFR